MTYVVIAVAAIGLALLYARTRWPGRLSWGAGLLKWTAVALIAVCLLEPLWSGTRAQPGENLVLVVADTSRSLTILDGPGHTERKAQFDRVLGDESIGWQVRLAQDFDVRRYRLSKRIDPVQTFEALVYDGLASNLGHSLVSLLDRFRSRPVAAVLVFTDGTGTDAALLERLQDGVPIYPVLPKTEAVPFDAAITQCGGESFIV